ncbi:hypothetical protein Q4595_20845, partial [Wenyingzhuangia sp. 1_MG-2023]|nr:hypothetical protein [Wenyingzhuangia sp. 1_MG-2023]
TTCDGLGVKQFFDPDRVITDPSLSIGEGAIRGWDRRSVYYFQLLSAVAEHYGFQLDVPFAELSVQAQEQLLYGSGDEEIGFVYVNSRGDQIRKQHPFEGVLPNLERRYHETESQTVREELSKYLSVQPCP